MYGLKKSYINSFIYLSPTSLHKPPDATYMHLWSFNEKVGQITTGIPCFAYFCDCAMRSQLSFLNSLITRVPSSGNWCRYKVKLYYNWKQMSENSELQFMLFYWSMNSWIRPSMKTTKIGSLLLILRSPKGGCCSISDDLSCSPKNIKLSTVWFMWILV